MHDSTQARLRGLRLTACVVLGALVWGAMPAPSSADLILTKPINRKFPQGLFCALPVDVTFTSPADRVTVEFQALRFVQDFFGDPLYTEQLIDNVVLATTAVHQANFGPPPPNSGLVDCYNCGGVFTTASYFYFNRFASLPFVETFDQNPAGRGWDMTQGAYWNTLQSAPNDVENDADFDGGSLLLGDQGPQADPYGRTSIEITGLTAGTSYTLSAWWNVNAVQCDGETPPVYLTITVSGQPPVGVGEQPLALGTWLGPAAPNPTHGRTRIAYRLPEPGRASLVIFDAQGRRVRELVSGVQEAGDHAVVWDGLDGEGRRVASGLYFYRLDVPRKALWGKVVAAR